MPYPELTVEEVRKTLVEELRQTKSADQMGRATLGGLLWLMRKMEEHDERLMEARNQQNIILGSIREIKSELGIN